MNPPQVQAQSIKIVDQVIEGPLRGSNIIGKNIENFGDLVNVILAFIYPVAGLIILYFFIQAGFIMVMSRGNADKFVEAKGKMITTVIGFVILMSAYLVARIIQEVFYGAPGILPR